MHQPASHPQQSARVQDCSVTISFGSFAMGIDRKAAARAEQIVASDRSVVELTRSRAGIEGEYALCVRTSSRGAALRLFERLRQTFRAPVYAPVSVTGPAGSFSAPVVRR